MQTIVNTKASQGRAGAAEEVQGGLSWTVLELERTGRVFTTRDAERLRGVLEPARGRATGSDAAAGEELRHLLAEGHVTSPKHIPCDVVTLNSRVLLEEQYSGASVAVTPVSPGSENKSKNKISVLSPLGMAIIGMRIRSEIEFKSSTGIQRICIRKILYQPEALGRYEP
jgi:regulator of nucleoside diphosphate kinase